MKIFIPVIIFKHNFLSVYRPFAEGQGMSVNVLCIDLNAAAIWLEFVGGAS